MRAYVCAVVRRHGNAREILRRFPEVAERALPFRVDDPTTAARSVLLGRTVLGVWSNEPEQPGRPLLLESPRGAVGLSGYMLTTPHIEDLLDSPAATLGRSGGVWSAVAAAGDSVWGASSAPGVEQLFVAESPDLVVVGNRALLVHLVADPDGPHHDLVGLAGVAVAGYCMTARTAYEGVRAVAGGEIVMGTAAGLASAQLGRAGGDAERSADADSVARALVASVEPLAAARRRVSLGLTGGRDSRLLVALLHAADVPVSTYTAGSPTDPDMLVARRVAQALGVPHAERPPAGTTAGAEDDLQVDVVGRLRDAVVLSDGMLTAYDRVGRVGAGYNPNLVPVTGHGGEVIRGHYAAKLADEAQPGAARHVLAQIVGGNARSLSEGLRQPYADDVGAWLFRADTEGAAALEDFYVRQRVARWSGAARASASIGSLAWRPLLDDAVVTAVRAQPLRYRTSEHLAADLLALLAPALRDVPFSGKRWAFERDAPVDGDVAAWQRRAPVVGRHGDEAEFNWRTDLVEVRQALRDVVLDSGPRVWDLLDRRRVEAFLNPARQVSRLNVQGAWHLATAAVVVSRAYEGPERRLGDLGAAVRVLRPPVPAAQPAANRIRHVPRRMRTLVRRARTALRRSASRS